jgi:hypothetical protein
MIEIEDLFKSISEDLSVCVEKTNYLDTYLRYKDGSTDSEEYEYNSGQLSYSIKSAYRKIVIILDSFGLHETLNIFKEEFAKYENKLTELTFISLIDELVSEPYGIIHSYYEYLSLIINKKKNSDIEFQDKLKRVRSILNATPKIIVDSKKEPKSETDVKDSIRNVLTYAFPDTVREIPIPNSVKTFKPDIGIPSLKLAIEYKYATTETEIKTCISGILEDVGGYKGTRDWINFIAVIYITETFFTNDQIQAQFKKNGLPKNWEIIPVFGKGERVKKSKKDATPRPPGVRRGKV